MEMQLQPADAGNPFADFIPRDEFSKRAGITKRTAELWAHERKGPKVTIIGGRAYYHLDDVRAWLDSLRKGDAKREPKSRRAA